MPLNENREARVVVLPESRAWSALSGGDLCRLESIPGVMETFFLRLLPGAFFSLSENKEDREVLVLSGRVLLDGRHWTAGAYLRLSSEAGLPALQSSEEGALLFIKSGRFPEEDRKSVGIGTKDRRWLPGLVEGLNVLPLFSGGTANTALVRWDPGTVFQPHRHFGGEEILVLSGVFEDELGRYPEGSWYRSPHMSRHDPFSTSGCTIFVKTGHLV